MTDVDIRGLAALARLEVSDEEVAALEREMPDMLAFVDTIQKADVADVGESNAQRNVMRSDESAHESGKYTEALLALAPAREGDRIRVKQVVSRQRSAKSDERSVTE
jgi:aspartyl/glutamyl-tRNA(Asn/Gln) amidotransferase C subunit